MCDSTGWTAVLWGSAAVAHNKEEQVRVSGLVKAQFVLLSFSIWANTGTYVATFPLHRVILLFWGWALSFLFNPPPPPLQWNSLFVLLLFEFSPPYCSRNVGRAGSQKQGYLGWPKLAFFVAVKFMKMLQTRAEGFRFGVITGLVTPHQIWQHSAALPLNRKSCWTLRLNLHHNVPPLEPVFLRVCLHKRHFH